MSGLFSGNPMVTYFIRAILPSLLLGPEPCAFQICARRFCHMGLNCKEKVKTSCCWKAKGLPVGDPFTFW